MTTCSPFQLEVASATDAGTIRSFNEDSIAADAELGLLVLADGMGGYKAGDVASAIATGLVMDELSGAMNALAQSPVPAGLSVEFMAVKTTVEKTNLAIYKTAQSDTKYTGMGTTLVLMMFHQNRATIAHVGDSRLYRVRQGNLDLLTHDHSLLQEQIERGLISSDDAKLSHNRNLVSRALGVSKDILVEINQHHVEPGDLYLLCSDGLNDMVDDTDIALALNALQTNLPLTARHLIQMAIDNGGHDNVSVIVAKVKEGLPARRTLMDRLFYWLKKQLG